jgi:hypothetical protein
MRRATVLSYVPRSAGKSRACKLDLFLAPKVCLELWLLLDSTDPLPYLYVGITVIIKI